MEGCQQHGSLTANQIGYNLFDRRVEGEVLPYCSSEGIGFMSYGSLGFGLLTGGLKPDTVFVDYDWRSGGMAFGLPLFKRENFLKELRVTERLKDLAAGYDKSVAQLALAWVLGNPAISVALVGMRNEFELRENVAAVDWRLADGDRAEIDQIFAEEDVPTYADLARYYRCQELPARTGVIARVSRKNLALRQPSCKPAGASSPIVSF